MEEEKKLQEEELEALSRNKKLELACIETFKVYDFCFQSERRENQCFDLRDCEVPVGSNIRCSIVGTTCEEIERGKPNKDGKAHVTFFIGVQAKLRIRNPEGDLIFKDEQTFGFSKTVVLCAPEGTETFCNIVNSSCGPCVVMCDQVSCIFDLCIVIHSAALVKLLVPSFGFCRPKPCEAVAPAPPISCPPNALFPLDCSPRPKWKPQSPCS